MNNYFIDFSQHLLEDDKPSEYFQKLINDDKFPRDYPFNMIYDLSKVDQNKEHHPEGSVWNHTMLVIDESAKIRDEYGDPKVFMWAALLHDIGKGPTTRIKKNRIVSYDHDKVGADMARDFLRVFNEDEKFINEVVSLIRWHMQILFIVKGLPFADLQGMDRDIHYEKVALLGLCDRLGRGNWTKESREKEEENIQSFIRICKEKLKK